MKTMQRMWDALKFLAIGTGAVLLFNFTNTRNLKRDITLGKITFVDDNEPFITENTVNKLLIQSKGGTAGIAKETLVLKEMESRLRKNQMVRDAQVYLHVNGTLGAKITQRNPVARVAAVPGFYLDADGKKMPLSTVYTARVPIVTASPGVQFKPLAPLLLAIENDTFMKRSVVGLNINNSGRVTLLLRKNNLKVLFGEPRHIEKKFQNFKAFYKKTKGKGYHTINLTFGDQVVAIKK